MAALGNEEVLCEEAFAIHGNGKMSAGLTGKDLYVALNNLNSTALCLSGGGIRSATFSLGVIQALSTHPRSSIGEPVAKAEDSLLSRVNFLSTVSGGGYLGGWLSAWMNRRYMAGATNWDAVWNDLAGKRTRPEDEAPEISWLRTYGNYLTPKLGLVSADTWAAVALSLRNLILNWLVILPLLCAVLLVLKLVALATAWFSQFNPQTCDDPLKWGVVLVSVLGCVLFVWALRFTTRGRPTRGPSKAYQGEFLLWGLLPATLAAVLFTFAVASPCTEIFVRNHLISAGAISAMGIGILSGIGAGLYAVAWIAALPRYRRFWDFAGDFAAWAVSGLVYGSLMALGLYVYIQFGRAGLWVFAPGETLLLIFGLPWAFTAQLLAEMIFIGLTSYEDGSDRDREWLGRAAGWYLIAAIAWSLLMFFVFVGSKLAVGIYGQTNTWLVGGGAGVITAWLGKSSSSPAKGEAKSTKGISANVILAIAAPIFAAVLIIGTSGLLDKILFGNSLVDTAAFHAQVTTADVPPWPGGPRVLFALMLVLITGAIASYFVNINRFSLHALYRNRLIRAFLGASNRKRAANRFTNFDEQDNMRLYALWPPETEPGHWPAVGPQNWRPFHVINMALNIVSTDKLAWQERKAESFTATPLHCGSSRLGYRYTTTYGDKQGISVGTAVAISGAAASPNMGYHSSAPLGFLLTLFNVRLGWWLGNPGSSGEDTYMRDGPKWAVVPLLYEMCGQTTDSRKYVYLSDGGHFENLGLYEMVRRRCRRIVVVDAGCDKEFGFEDLGNAVRKVELDLGVRITFQGLSALRYRAKKRAEYGPLEPPYHAVGTIHYLEADGGGQQGIILYLKPAFHGNRLTNVGVRNYAFANTDFPHQTTGDQFFSESQFESYRSLGYEMMDAVLKQVLDREECARDRTLEDLFSVLPKTVSQVP